MNQKTTNTMATNKAPSAVLPETMTGDSAAADELHQIFNRLPVYSWQTIKDVPFKDGIYIVFEKEETYKGLPRIVRVGTHTSPGRLKQRLRSHFLSEHHNSSIFRKNIGKVLLLYNGTIPKNTAIQIKDGTKGIASYAFSLSSPENLISITLPYSLTTLSNGALSDCTSLKNVNLSANVSSIGNSAFSGCSNLTSITIPSSVTTIGDDAFKASGIISVTIPFLWKAQKLISVTLSGTVYVLSDL